MDSEYYFVKYLKALIQETIKAMIEQGIIEYDQEEQRIVYCDNLIEEYD